MQLQKSCEVLKFEGFIDHTLLKMLGCFNPILGKIWTNPAIGLKCHLKM